MKRAEMKEDWIRTYLMGLEGHTKIQWPEGQIPEGWSEFFAARQLGHQVSANSNSGMCLSELLHEGLTVAMAAKRFGLLGGRGGREGHGGDHGRHRRPFRLHILGATETQEIQRLPLSMGELGALLCPFYFEGKPPPLPSGAGRINYRHASSRLTVVSPSFLPSLPPSSTPKGLEVSVFGPQVMTPTAFRVSLAEGKETARDITVWKSNLLYHNWVLSHEGSKEAPPDLVVALNSGLHTGGEIWRGGGGRKVEGKRQKKHSEWWRLSLSQPPPTAMPPVLDIISPMHSALSFFSVQRHASLRVFPSVVTPPGLRRRSSPRGRLHVATHPYLPGRVRDPISAYHVRRGGREEDPGDAGVVRRVRCMGPRLEPHAVAGLGGNGGTGLATVRPPGRGWAHGRRGRRAGRSIATLGIDVV